MTDTMFKPIARSLHESSDITQLSIRENKLSYNSIIEVTKLIKNNSSMISVDISWNQIGSEGVREMCEHLIDNKSLKALYMNSVGIDSATVTSITHLFRNNNTLDTLELSNNNLPGSSSDSFKRALKHNYSLTSLNLEGNEDMEPKDLEDISDILERNASVQDIIESLVANSCQRRFKTRMKVFNKSIRGKEMLMGRKAQMKRNKGTSLHDLFIESEKISKIDVPRDTRLEQGRFRVGEAEMLGQRFTYEDAYTSIGVWLTEEITSFWTKEINFYIPDFENDKFEIVNGEYRNFDLRYGHSSFYAVYDGHGGREVADYAASNLHHEIRKLIIKEKKTIEDALSESFVNFHQEIKAWANYTGSTAIVTLILENRIFCANVGDSRAILSRDGTAIRLSVDHRPDIEEEKQSIEALGGFVKEGRLNGMLAVSRALGDGFLENVINPEPYVCSTELTQHDDFLILACDGVFDVVTDQEAVDIVATEMDPQKAAKKLREESYTRGSLDNITVLVIFFR